MEKLHIPALLIGWLATIASGDIIYGKPGGLMQLQQPSSSAVSPTVAQPNNGNELLTGAETGYGPYGAQAYGGHLGGFGGGGGCAGCVVVTGGYKVADAAPHHGIQHGLGGHGHGIPLEGQFQGGGHLGGHNSIQGGPLGAPQGHIQPIAHGHVPVIEHEHGDIGDNAYAYGFPGNNLQHGHGHPGHGQLGHPGHGIGLSHGHVNPGHHGHYRHHPGHQGGYRHHHGYGLHVPSHGLIGHQRGHGHGYGHHPHHHRQSGFRPILAPIGHGYGGYGQQHHHQLRPHHHHEHGLGLQHLQQGHHGIHSVGHGHGAGLAHGLGGYAG
ncbi:hypothetical protein Ocin01_01711 [Orchesella cincta]|uniref:Uncharacterized protein n=1 Tax=Orchesella cincta TaxID=48709 RepID=A0A1D2NI85_ORCCI|nr:hypothetical protein Ocin01_01711 [Orchesella cincta]